MRESSGRDDRISCENFVVSSRAYREDDFERLFHQSHFFNLAEIGGFHAIQVHSGR